MVFSKEEQEIWAKSEVMRELERIARTQSLETPNEAFLPIKEGQDWEDEPTDEERLVDALEDFEKDDEKNKIEIEEDVIPLLNNETEFKDDEAEFTPKTEGDDIGDDEILEILENDIEPSLDREEKLLDDVRNIESSLVDGLTKLASDLGSQGKVVEASKVEDTIRDIRIALREANNG